MIDTFMALWNRKHEGRKRVLFIVSALFLIGMSLSLLLATLSHIWSLQSHQAGITSMGIVGTAPPTSIVITTVTVTPTTTVLQNCLPSPTPTMNRVPTQPGSVNVQGGSRGSEPTASPVTRPVRPTPTVAQKPSATPTTAPQPEPTPIPTLPATLTPVLQLTPTPTVVPLTPTPTSASSPTATVTPPTPTLTPAPLTTATPTPTVTVTPSPTVVVSPTVIAPGVSPTASVTATITAAATVEGNQQQGSEFSGGGGGMPAGNQGTAAAGNGWMSNCSSNRPVKPKPHLAMAFILKPLEINLLMLGPIMLFNEILWE